MKHILKYSMLLTAISALLIGCAGPAVEIQKERTMSETDLQMSASAAKMTGNETAANSFPLNPSLLSLFPQKADPNDYSRGITQSSTLWQASQEVSVFTMGEDGTSQVTNQVVKTLPQGKKFRICALVAASFNDPQSSKIYGQMADGSGLALLYDHFAATPQMADFKEDSAWPMKTMIRLKPGTVLYEDQTGITPLQSNSSQILIHLATAKDGTIWGHTQQGWFQWIDENGPRFYSAPEGVVVGPLIGSDSLEEVYRQILVGKTFENAKGSLNWGYALADLNQNQIPELLIASGGKNQDQVISVYGLTSNVIDRKEDASFSAANTLLYTTSNASSGANELLVFQTLEDGYKISRIDSADGNIQMTELSADENKELKAETLQEIQFVSINDLTHLDPLQPIFLSELYPDYRSSGFSSESAAITQAPSALTWKLNYDMTVRKNPERTSAQSHVLPKDSLINIIQESKNGVETWGKLEIGGWVCLQDAEYVYASPEIGNVEKNSSTNWYEIYGQILRNEMNNSPYGSSRNYEPRWYLWDHPEYENPLLVMKIGSCEADYQLKFYAVANGTAQEIASCKAGHIGFYSGPESGTFYTWWGHMGSECISLIALSQGSLTSNEIYSRTEVMEYQTPDGEPWNFQPVSAW